MTRIILTITTLCALINLQAQSSVKVIENRLSRLEIPAHWQLQEYHGHDTVPARSYKNHKMLQTGMAYCSFINPGGCSVQRFIPADRSVRLTNADVREVIRHYMADTDKLSYDAANDEWWINLDGEQPCVKNGRLTTETVCRKKYIRCRNGEITVLDISCTVRNSDTTAAQTVVDKVHDSWVLP